MLDKVLLKRLTYAKYLHDAASVRLDSPSPIVAAEALLRFHDSIEIFQLVVLDKLGISRKKDSSFMEFWEQVKNKVGREPPYKDRLRQLNAMRVAFKHDAILPNLSELRELVAAVSPFFAEVSADLMDLDLSTVSLAELVDDFDVRDHVKAAEGLIQSKDYRGALSKLAIAFYIVVHAKYSEIPGYLRSISELFSSDGSSHPPRLRGLNLPHEALAAVSKIEDALTGLHSQLQEQQAMLEMVAWRIDLQRYSKFKYLTPTVFQTGDGKFHIAFGQSIGRPYVEKDCAFCLQFVLDTALVIQVQKFRLPDRFKPCQIKTNADPTVLYKVDSDGSETRIAEIPKDVQLLGTFCFAPKSGEAWQVDYQGSQGVIRVSDATLMIDE